MVTTLKITNRDDLPRGGFAGVRETRVVAPYEGASKGLGSFIYLADAEFIPNGETGMHPHRDVDIVSVMLKGNIQHRGTLEDGSMLSGRTIQVQRSGTGMMHNEVNPDTERNRMLQIWFLPPQRGLDPAYKTYSLNQGETVTILGGDDGESFDNACKLEAALLKAGQTFKKAIPFIAYLAEGAGNANGTEVREGALIEGGELEFEATEDAELMVITQNS